MIGLKKVFKKSLSEICDDLNAHLVATFADNIEINGQPKFTVTTQTNVRGQEVTGIVLRDQIKVLIDPNFIQKNKDDNAGLMEQVHREAADFLVAKGFSPKTYQPVLASGIAPQAL